MNENELLKIQCNQVNEQIEKIKWIANNSAKLIRALRAKVSLANGDYFDLDDAPVSWIFRGQDIDTWMTNYVALEIIKKRSDDIQNRTA